MKEESYFLFLYPESRKKFSGKSGGEQTKGILKINSSRHENGKLSLFIEQLFFSYEKN